MTAFWSALSAATMGCICGKETVAIDNRRFIIRSRLGEGGFSYVDLVEDSRTHKLYALKKIANHSKDDEKVSQKEIEYMTQFDHPNLVPLEAHIVIPLKSKATNTILRGAISETLIIMPCYRKGSLQDELESLSKKSQHLEEARLLRLFRGVCEGVKTLHTHETNPATHRDIKPHNVMYNDDDTPVLMDFGSMGPAKVEIKGTSQATSLQDLASERCSMPYRAPELFNVDSYGTIDEKIDIWSLGCTLHAMCFYESPFDKVYQRGDSIALAVMAGNIKMPRSSYSKGVTDLISAMLAVDPTERPDIHRVIQRVDALVAHQSNRA